ncbi:GMC family oxidoreductase [Streptomyces violaceoruber]|uniref:GMC oxidoreductase n=1 Tax=Streptomyces violaceoruber TaxID=1935 RepID=UPI001F30EF9D|nr:GMC oxidoreductase [Streptomyces violaceoruber]MCF3165802.1 GMC family oxidoreductase [Streptomyces violaceoruber]
MVVVGGGLAGLALARRLADRHPGRVVVVESGPDAGRDHYRWVNDPERADELWLDPAVDPHFWQPYEPSDSGYRGIAGLRRRLGGRSLYWGGVVVPIESWALESGEWPAPVVRDLTTSWQGGSSLYETAAEEVRRWAGGGPTTAEPLLSFAGREFTEAPRAVREFAGEGRWRAYSPLDDWPHSVETLCDSHAVAVVASGGRVTGLLVERAGERQVISAPTIVLAAGTVENSRLVLQTLREIDDASPLQLTGLADKLAQGFAASFDPAAVPPSIRALAESGRLHLSRADGELRSSLFIQGHINPHGLLIVDCYCMGEQRPGDAGRVWCEPGPRLPWPTFVAGGLSSVDEQLVQDQRDALNYIHAELCRVSGTSGDALAFTDPFGSVDLGKRLAAGDAMAFPGLASTYSFPIGSEQHEAGTLPLGGALVDDDAKVRAVDGLYVTGPAVFPRTGAANPALTILALAARLAEQLVASEVPPVR